MQAIRRVDRSCRWTALFLALAIASWAKAEDRGYVVSLFVPAMNSTDDDCPDGLNPNAADMLRRILADQGMPKEEIEKFMLSKEYNARGYSKLATYRGRIDGKPVNVYRHPLSVPDPQIKLASMKHAYGFNLDGRVDADDFVDPLTGEKGVDHASVRVFGCFDRTRGTLETPNAHWSGLWGVYNYGNTWLISISGIDDPKNDDNVEVRFYRGLEPAIKNGQAWQPHITYSIDPDPRMQSNRLKGKIKDGMFLSDEPIQFYMLSSSRGMMHEVKLEQARLRLTLKPDGGVEGFVGGFALISTIYYNDANYGGAGEFNSGMDYPGLYYALRRLADTDIGKDPKTGQPTHISMTYLFRGEPAFLLAPQAEPVVSKLRK